MRSQLQSLSRLTRILSFSENDVPYFRENNNQSCSTEVQMIHNN